MPVLCHYDDYGARLELSAQIEVMDYFERALSGINSVVEFRAVQRENRMHVLYKSGLLYSAFFILCNDSR